VLLRQSFWDRFGHIIYSLPNTLNYSRPILPWSQSPKLLSDQLEPKNIFALRNLAACRLKQVRAENAV
jgi:hypothetical protein